MTKKYRSFSFFKLWNNRIIFLKDACKQLVKNRNYDHKFIHYSYYNTDKKNIVKIYKHLISKDFNINSVNTMGENQLIIASKKKERNVELIDLLLKIRANTNKKMNMGKLLFILFVLTQE